LLLHNYWFLVDVWHHDLNGIRLFYHAIIPDINALNQGQQPETTNQTQKPGLIERECRVLE
jgi:hypothetical protein